LLKMLNKKRIEDKERILRYLFRKGSLCNTYKVARELDMERFEVLDILNELAKEDKVKLMHGSVKAVTKELSQEEIVKTKSEVEELKERMEKLEKVMTSTFNRLREAIDIGQQKIRKNLSKVDISDNSEKIEVQKKV